MHVNTKQLPFLPDLAAHRYPDAHAVLSGNTVLSYAQLAACSSKVAEQLLSTGFATGDRLAVHATPSIETIVTIWAAMRAGLIVMPLSTRFPKAQLHDILRETVSAGLVCPDAGLCPPDVQHVPAGVLVRTLDCVDSERPDSFSKSNESGHASILLTSGSSGRAKFAVHSYANHYFSADGAHLRIPFKTPNRWLVSLPLYHAGGFSLLFRAALLGGTLVLPDQNHSLAENVLRNDITHLSLVATQLRRLLESTPGLLDGHRLKAVLTGGGPVPPDLVQRAAEAGLPVCLTYGSTEMASQIATSESPASAVGSRSPVTALPHCELRIAENGEVLVRGRSLASGYLDGGHLQPLTDSEGWFHTGDLGQTDSTGGLQIQGRIDNMFISGGENIQPEEIERALQSIPEIVDALVVPWEDIEFGHRPVAFIHSEPGSTLSPERYDAALAREIAKFKIPVAYLDWPTELTQNGLKPDRARFRKMAEALLRSEKKNHFTM